MSELTRRGMLGGALVLAICLSRPLTARTASFARIDLPAGAMILHRRVERPLSDGAMIVVARSWEVRFARSGQGAVVDGRQVDCIVEAPAKLNGLAEIERDRSTDDMFPILLSSDGRIVGTGMPDDEGELVQAVRIASDLIGHSNKSGQEKETALRYLAVLQAAGNSVVNTLPPDLFYPAGSDQHDLRKLSLPNGQLGEIELIRTSQRAIGQHWLDKSVRRVVTRVAGTSQESREIWTMRPL